MKQTGNKIQEGVSSIFQGNSIENTADQSISRIASQRKFFLTGRRSREPRNERERENIRTSVMMNRSQYAKVREIAIREGLTIKDLLFSMIELAIEQYEKKHGKVIINNTDKTKNLFK